MLTWTNLLPGEYTVTEQDPGASWQVTITGSPAAIPLGGSASAAVENHYVPPTCEVNPALLGVPLPQEGNPTNECALYGLVPVCKDGYGSRRGALVRGRAGLLHERRVHDRDRAAGDGTRPS